MRGHNHTLSIFLLAGISVFYSVPSSASGWGSATEVAAAQPPTVFSSVIGKQLRLQNCLKEVEKSLNSYSLDKNLSFLTERLSAQLQGNLSETAELLQTVNIQASSFDEVDLQVLSASVDAVEEATSFSGVAKAEALRPFLINAVLENEYPASCLAESSLSFSETLNYKLGQAHVYFNMGISKVDFRLANLNKRLRALKKKQMSDPRVSGLTRT